MRLRAQASKLLRAGFFHIFGASTLNKALTFLCGVFVVRILTKADYGVYSYAYNEFNMILLFNGLGATSALLQMGSEDPDPARVGALSRYGFKAGLTFDVALILCVLAFIVLVPSSIPGSGFILALFLVFLVPQFLVEMQMTLLRVQFRNRAFSWATNINTVLIVGASLGGAVLLGSMGLVNGRNVAEVLCLVIICALFRVPSLRPDPADKVVLSKDDRASFLKIAVVSAVNNGLGQLTYLIGTVSVGALLADAEAVATYQAATVIPTALNFVPVALMTFAYPYFARHHREPRWILSNFKRLLLGASLLAGGITALCLVLAPQIVTFVYGANYIEAVESFRILMLGFFVASTLRIICGNLLVSQRKLLFNTATSVATAAVLPVLNFYLIPALGIVGAAWAQVVVIAATGIANTVYFLHVIHAIPTEEHAA